MVVDRTMFMMYYPMLDDDSFAVLLTHSFLASSDTFPHTKSVEFESVNTLDLQLFSFKS